MSPSLHRCSLAVALACATLAGGCASLVRPYDELGVWLDRYPFETSPGAGPRPRPTQPYAQRAPRPQPAAQHVRLATMEEPPLPDAEGELSPETGREPIDAGPRFAVESEASGYELPAIAPPANKESSTSLTKSSAGDCCCDTCGGAVCEVCPLEGALCHACSTAWAACPCLHKPPKGPPPVRYLPPMPPKFLPVPTCPVYGQGRTGPLELPRGNVERGFGPVLTIAGGD